MEQRGSSTPNTVNPFGSVQLKKTGGVPTPAGRPVTVTPTATPTAKTSSSASTPKYGSHSKNLNPSNSGGGSGGGGGVIKQSKVITPTSTPTSIRSVNSNNNPSSGTATTNKSPFGEVHLKSTSTSTPTTKAKATTPTTTPLNYSGSTVTATATKKYGGLGGGAPSSSSSTPSVSRFSAPKRASSNDGTVFVSTRIKQQQQQQPSPPPLRKPGTNTIPTTSMNNNRNSSTSSTSTTTTTNSGGRKIIGRAKSADDFIGYGGTCSNPAESYNTSRLTKTGTRSRLDPTGSERVNTTSSSSTSTALLDDSGTVWITGILSKAKSMETTTKEKDKDKEDKDDDDSMIVVKKAMEYIKRIQDANGLPALRRLSVRDNDLVTNLTRAISNDPTLTEIKIINDIRFSYLNPSLIVHFGEAIRTNVTLQTLIITGVELGNDFLSALSDSIGTNFNLQYIDLSNNNFTNDALVDFCIGIGENVSIHTVLIKKQQSPIFTHREDVVIEALYKNVSIRTYEIEFQTQACADELTKILERNNKNQNKVLFDYRTKLLSFLEKEAILAERVHDQKKQEATAREVVESDMPYLYELSVLAQQFKLPYDTTTGTSSTGDTTGSSTSHPSSSTSTPTAGANNKTSIAKISSNLLTADGAFLTNEFIDQYLVDDMYGDQSLTFEFTNECRVFQRFTVTDPARALIVSKFVDALMNHPRSSLLTHLHMANTMIGNDFCIALRDKCIGTYHNSNGKTDSLLPLRRLHLINVETNLITGPGISALAECIGHTPPIWPYLQALKMDNQRHLISSEAESDLANALCVNRSVIKISLRVRTLFERRKVNNFIVRNVDFLRQARRWHGLKTGTIKERERNKIEKLFDAITSNDPNVTEVNLVSDQVFVSLSPEEVIKAADSFANNKYVTKVKMSGLRLDDKFGIAMGTALTTNTSIEKLDLESNSIGSEGIVAIVSALQVNRTLTELLVRHQSKPMASTDEEKIPSFIVDNESILKFSIDVRSIGVRDNVDKVCRINQEKKRKKSPKNNSPASGGFDGIPAVSTKRNRIQQLFDNVAANDPSITEVELVSDQVFLGLNEVELEKAALSFAINTYVTKVKMSGLKLDDTFGIALAKSITTNRSIQKLDLERNSFGTDGMSALLLAALSCNKTITELFVRHQSKPMSSTDEEKIPSYMASNEHIIKLSIDIRSVGAKSSIEKKIRMNQELKRKSK